MAVEIHREVTALARQRHQRQVAIQAELLAELLEELRAVIRAGLLVAIPAVQLLVEAQVARLPATQLAMMIMTQTIAPALHVRLADLAAMLKEVVAERAAQAQAAVVVAVMTNR